MGSGTQDILTAKVQHLEEEREVLLSQVGELVLEIQNIKKRNSELRRRIVRNHKTGLPNHFMANHKIKSILKQKQDNRDLSPVVFLFVKLNNSYEDVTKILKPAISEWVLYQVSLRLKKLCGNRIFVFHMKEDEFLLLYYDMEESHKLELFLEVVGEELRKPYIISGYNISIDSNCGVALFPEHGLDAKTLLHNAKIALGYSARHKKPYTIYSDEINQLVIQKMELQNSILKALEGQNIENISKQFFLNFQPIVVLDTSGGAPAITKIMAESLIRWDHPERGLMSPDDFIPLAEETGLIIPLGTWVCFRAARYLQSWSRSQNLENIQLSINLSPRQFHDPALVDNFKRMVNSFELIPGNMKLEVTETSLMDNLEKAIKKLKELRALGFRISLDDFGTGYSSLNYLKDLPVDTIKIDKSFIDRIHENPVEKAILRGILFFIDELNMDLIVEGVENMDQLKILLDLGCRTFQGYFFSKPLGDEQFMNYRERNLGRICCPGFNVFQ